MNISNQLLAKYDDLTEGKGKTTLTKVSEIEDACEELGIEDYKVNPSTLLVDVRGDVDLSRKLKGKSIIDSLGFSFGKVGGDFLCNSCDSLESLEGAPEKVGGDFLCDNSKSLKTLEGSPKVVGGDFDYTYCPKLKNKNLPKTTKVKGKVYK